MDAQTVERLARIGAQVRIAEIEAELATLRSVCKELEMPPPGAAEWVQTHGSDPAVLAVDANGRTAWASVGTGRVLRRNPSKAARLKMARAAKRRWAKVKQAGGNSLGAESNGRHGKAE